MNKYILNSRIELLKKLHSIMMCMNDEEAYMLWIEIVPDEPTDADFESIAEDDKFFHEVLTRFHSLFGTYKNYE